MMKGVTYPFPIAHGNTVDEFGMIDGDGPFTGLYLRPLVLAFRDSANDWPETVGAIGLDEYVDGDTMHPLRAGVLRILQQLTDEEWEADDLCFDT